LPQKSAAGHEALKVSKKNSKIDLKQKAAIDTVPKQPAAAEESFYTGRGVQPRKTIDGLPVFSLAEMVPRSNNFWYHVLDSVISGHQPGLWWHSALPVRL
jgi:hypothetical protein